MSVNFYPAHTGLQYFLFVFHTQANGLGWNISRLQRLGLVMLALLFCHPSAAGAQYTSQGYRPWK
jgi:hypothetical protein